MVSGAHLPSSGGLGPEHVLVEVPGQGGPSGFVRGDLGAQEAGDPAGAGDHAEACGDLLGGVVVAAAGRVLELVEVLAGRGVGSTTVATSRSRAA